MHFFPTPTLTPPPKALGEGQSPWDPLKEVLSYLVFMAADAHWSWLGTSAGDIAPTTFWIEIPPANSKIPRASVELEASLWHQFAVWCQASCSLSLSLRAPLSWDFPGKNPGVGCHFFLQGTFPTQGWSPHLLYCSWILYLWATREDPISLWEWKWLSCVQLYATPWTIQSMEFSRPEYWSV